MNETNKYDVNKMPPPRVFLDNKIRKAATRPAIDLVQDRMGGDLVTPHIPADVVALSLDDDGYITAEVRLAITVRVALAAVESPEPASATEAPNSE